MMKHVFKKVMALVLVTAMAAGDFLPAEAVEAAEIVNLETEASEAEALTGREETEEPSKQSENGNLAEGSEPVLEILEEQPEAGGMMEDTEEAVTAMSEGGLIASGSYDCVYQVKQF